MEPLHREVHRPSVRLLLSAHAADSRAWLMLHDQETRQRVEADSGVLRRTERELSRLWVYCQGEGKAESAWALDSLWERRKQGQYQEGLLCCRC